MAVAITFLIAEVGSTFARWSNATVAKPIVPSREIALRPGANGLVTEVTCGSRATSPSIRATFRCTPGAAKVPFGVRRTIWSESPDWAGNRLESRSAARCASVPGNVKLLP